MWFRKLIWEADRENCKEGQMRKEGRKKSAEEKTAGKYNRRNDRQKGRS
jgi:hypothetical protein